MKIHNLFFAVILFQIVNCGLTTISFSQGVWTQKSNFSGTARQEAVGFAIGSKGYVCGGRDASWVYQPGFWEYDPVFDTWTQKADTPAIFRSSAVALSISGKGYICTGVKTGGWPTDMWEYDPASNTWTKKTDFPGTARWGAISFTIGNKGYVGMGWDLSVNNVDLWEYDPSNNSWLQMANKPGPGVTEAVGFSVSNKGYVALGLNGGNDLWEYDPSNNSWTSKANFPGSATQALVGFTIGTKGYIGTGCCYKKDFWEYDPSNNSWTQKPDFGGTARGWAVGFSIGCKGYIGTGYDPASKQDFWEYCPDTICCNNTLNATISSQNIVCNNQCTGAAAASPSGGSIPYTYSWNTFPIQTTQTATGLCAGSYTVTVSDAVLTTTTATVSITQPSALTATAAATNSMCGNTSGSATVTAGGGTPGYTYVWNPSGQTISAVSGLAAGNYTITVTDANGCTSTQTVTVVSSGGSTNTNQSASICSGTSYTLPGGTVVSIAGTYNDTLASVNGCDSIITTTLTVNSVFSTTQSASICTGATYTLPGGTVVSTAGMYNDTLTSTSGCDSIITTNLTVNPNPSAVAFSNTTIAQGQSVTLTASGGGTYSWNNGSTENIITVTPPVTTIYCVMVTDANNCTDTACVTVTIEPIDCSNAGELYIPNAFSPNGDNENDVLKIYYGNPQCIKTFKLIIYDRWGEKVFETKNPIAEWDGFYKGKTENTAVFVYYLETTLISGEEIIKRGNVSLVK